MSVPSFTTRFFLKQAVLSLLYLSIPVSVPAASVLKMIIPAVLANQDKPVQGPHWRTPQRIESNTGFFWTGPQLTADGTGNVFVTWSQQAQPNTAMRAWMKRYHFGSGWQVTQTMDTNTGHDAYAPNLAISAIGAHAALVWREANDTYSYDLYTRLYGAATGWTEPMIIQDQVAAVSSPLVSMDTAGNVMTAWHEGYKPAILKARRYAAGSGWETTVVLIPYSTDISDIHLGMDAQGNALLVWALKPMYTYSIMASRYQSGVGWTEPQAIEQVSWPQDPSSSDIALAMLPSGTAMVVWTRDGKIWLNSYEPGNGWGTEQSITPEGGNAGYPDVASNEAGHKVVVWQQSDGTRTNIWANYYVPGSGWGTAQLIESNDAGDARYPKVTINAAGTVVAAWQQSDGTHTNIWANRYVPGSGGWGTAQLIETNDAGDARYPKVVSTDDNAMVVWQQDDGSHTNIWAARFE